jgi:hypothetical protein
VGLVAKKSTWRKDSPDNMGEFQIIDPKQNLVVDGSRYDCTPAVVVALCKKMQKSRREGIMCCMMMNE